MYCVHSTGSQGRSGYRFVTASQIASQLDSVFLVAFRTRCTVNYGVANSHLRASSDAAFTPSRLRFESLESRQLLAGDLELVKDINTLKKGSGADNLVQVGNTVYFTANDGVNGVELWKSDGTEAAQFASRISFLDPMAPLRASLRMCLELCTSWLTTRRLTRNFGRAMEPRTGTVRVKEIRPSNYGAYPTHLTNVNGTLYFIANDGLSGFEPLEERWNRLRHHSSDRYHRRLRW